MEKPVEHDQVRKELDEAGTALTQALDRLRGLRRRLLSGAYDGREFLAAVDAYLDAERRLLAARRAWNDGTRAQTVTPRMRFARWLVQTGRLSDWPTTSDCPPPIAPLR